MVSATGYFSEPTIEFTWALILAAARNLSVEERSMRDGGWQSTVGRWESCRLQWRLSWDPEGMSGPPTPPDGLPIYGVLTGPDDAGFCRRVSDAIALGYRSHDGPAVTFNGEQVIVAQALLWPEAGDQGSVQ